MIISYYGKAFFGGGTFYKLSQKKDNENFKYQYMHSVVNYFEKAREYLKNYEDLVIANYEKKLENKLNSIKINNEKLITELISYIYKVNWKTISKKTYSNDKVFDGLCWIFYIEFDSKSYEIEGYEDLPVEIRNILDILDKIKNNYIGDIALNNFEKQLIKRNKKSNIKVMKILKK